MHILSKYTCRRLLKEVVPQVYPAHQRRKKSQSEVLKSQYANIWKFQYKDEIYGHRKLQLQSNGAVIIHVSLLSILVLGEQSFIFRSKFRKFAHLRFALLVHRLGGELFSLLFGASSKTNEEKHLQILIEKLINSFCLGCQIKIDKRIFNVSATIAHTQNFIHTDHCDESATRKKRKFLKYNFLFMLNYQRIKLSIIFCTHRGGRFGLAIVPVQGTYSVM